MPSRTVADFVLRSGPPSPYLPTVNIEAIGGNSRWGAVGSQVRFRASAASFDGRPVLGSSFRWILRQGFCNAKGACGLDGNVLQTIEGRSDVTFKLPLTKENNDKKGCAWFFVRADATDECGRNNLAVMELPIPGRCGFVRK